MKMRHYLIITLKSLPHITDAVSEEHNTTYTGHGNDKGYTATTTFSFDKPRFKSVKYKLIIILNSAVQFLLRKENQQ